MPAHEIDHPTSYTAWSFNEHGGSLKKIHVQWKHPADGEVVLKVLACGICGTDKTVVSDGILPVPLPRIPGHEVVGDVVAVGPNEKLWSVGDHVSADAHGGHSHKCDRCGIGDFTTCVEGGLVGILTDRGHADITDQTTFLDPWHAECHRKRDRRLGSTRQETQHPLHRGDILTKQDTRGVQAS